MDNNEDKKQEYRLLSIFPTERLEDYMALILAAFILILVLLLF